MKRNATILFLVIGLIVAGGAFLLRHEAGIELPAAAPAAAVQPPAEQAVAGTSSSPAVEAAVPSADEAKKPDTPNPFAARTWAPPRPVVPVITIPPAPQAPPLPFRFLGRVSDPERGDAFMLTAGDRVLSVKAGDVLDGQYLVEAYRDGQLHFLYQPLNIRQTLFVGHDS
ncbi:MAG: hypothetical protein KIT42_16510 [Rhodocyclaceae bacterium]|nr:hypothetical protein [Rhodocyclaceae bacterium]